MCALQVEQRQYKTYILTDPTNQSRIEILPEKGGIVTSWKVDDREIFYLDAERLTHPELSVRGGIPILFPICGNLPDNAYTHNGQPYTLKQHGFARDLPWQVVESSTSDAASDSSITLTLSSSTETLKSYPFEFEVAFTYELHGNVLTIRQQYTNHSAVMMPFVSGLHPYFSIEDKSKLRFEIPATQYWDHKALVNKAYFGSFDFELDEIDIGFKELSGAAATAIDLDRQLRMTLTYDSSYSTVVFWTVKGKDFYCIEPWTAPRNALNTGEHLLTIQPGATLEMSVSMTADFGK